MDPITQAMRRFAADTDAFWRANPHRLLPLRAYEDQREEVVQALRLHEAAPDNRRPFMVFREPFETTSGYFNALTEQIAADYERVRKGAAEEGVELPAFVVGDEGTVPSGAMKRAVLAMNHAARLLEERLAGIVVALVPEHVVDARGWRENIRVLSDMRGSPCVRVAVLAPPNGPLSELFDGGGVLFDLPPDDLLAFLEHGAGPGSDGAAVDDAGGVARQLRRLMLQAGAAMAAQQPAEAVTLFEQARALCAAERLVMPEVAALMGMGGACVVARATDLGIESYSKAAGLAEQAREWAMACHAWLGAGGAYLVRESHGPAALAYRAAATAAKEAGLAILQIEALRMAGTCLVRSGCESDALLAWKEALDVGMELEVAERRLTTFKEVAGALAELLDGRGLDAQALHVRSLAEA